MVLKIECDALGFDFTMDLKIPLEIQHKPISEIKDYIYNKVTSYMDCLVVEKLLFKVTLGFEFPEQDDWAWTNNVLIDGELWEYWGEEND